MGGDLNLIMDRGVVGLGALDVVVVLGAEKDDGGVVEAGQEGRSYLRAFDEGNVFGDEVVVSNIGLVYSGGNLTEARKIFREYTDQSKTGYGRGGGEDVTMMKYGKAVWEFFGGLNRRET